MTSALLRTGDKWAWLINRQRKFVHLHCIIANPEVLAVVVHDSSLGCDVTSLDEWLWTFRRNLLPLYLRG